ncbi:MAG: hypothetical protein GW893_10710 [Armatimonadetes bacterium]|nr:hypothetical protein [Armatimonadota bacterium]PJB64341.1 MAG: hypothetical protein CO095_14985 [Armatimonadetes bacterium CG_4_9_14_3_um_filter_58_7]
MTNSHARPIVPRWLFLVGILVGWTMLTSLSAATGAEGESVPSATHSLSDFGPVATAAEADASLTKAIEELTAGGGGVLIIPKDAPADWRPENLSQASWREPPPPAPAKRWGYTNGITIVDQRDGTMKLYLPQMTGMEFHRLLQLPEGQSAGHWDYHPMLSLQNSIVRGTTSYRDWITEDVKAGENRRIYVNTLRGLFPGMFLNSGDHGQVSRLYVKSLGFDKEKRQPYIMADVDVDLTARGALLHNKTHANVLRADTYSHTENQTFDVMVNRHNYSQGDNYMYYAGFNYMGDVHSTAGDENGVLYAAFAHSMSNSFRATVDTFDAKTGALKYKGAGNAHTLGTGRPMINLNEKKWITAGTVTVVRPGSWWDVGDHIKDPVFEGKTYPTKVLNDASTSGRTELRMGGLIRFSKDAPVTDDAIGRYFAVDEPNEYVPGGNKVRRWYLIDSVQQNPDGTKEIKIIRHWWGAKPAGSPTLYRPENCSEDGRVKPLKYVIAPGSNVYDVSRGVKDDGPWGGRYVSGALDRIVKVAPGPHSDTPMDFAAGDPVEQVVGPDPFKPIPFRSWLFENVPGPFPAPVLDIANHGETTRASVLTVAGGPATIAECDKRADGRPPFENVITINSACYEGIVFGGDTATAAIAFRQPGNRPQPIKWLYDNQKKEATLTVRPEDGAMRFDGGGFSLPGGAFNVAGISGTTTKAQNLRGVNVSVAAGAKEAVVKFPKPEADADYAVFLETSWLTPRAVAQQTAEGFTVQFETAPAGEGKLHWVLVR